MPANTPQSSPPKSSRPDLVNGPIAKTLLMFALPVLGSNILQSLNASVNAIWVGHYLGEAALTATSNANIILFFLLGVVFGISMATTILVGQSIGGRDINRAKRVVGTGATFFATLSILVAAAGYIFTPHILAMMQTPADAAPYAIAYLRIIFIALPMMYFYNFMMMTLRGAGDSRTPFYFMLLSVGLDIALNPLLIFGLGPVPAMGIAGSALATLIAQSGSLLLMIAFLYRRKHFLALHSNELNYLKPDLTILRALVLKGLPMGLQMLVISSSALVMISLVNSYGSQVTAGYGVTSQLWTYVQMPALALGASVSSMAAQNIGAGRWDRVSRIAGIGVGYNFLLTGALVALLYLFDHAALGLFLPHEGEAMAVARHINNIVAWSFVLFGVTMVLFGVVRSTGAVMAPLVTLFIAIWLVRLPFAKWLMPAYGAEAIWWSTDPRMVLMTDRFKVSDSLAKAIRRVERSAATDGRWQLRFDGDFEAVMRACAAPRKDGPGTWISDEIIAGYTGLHALGYAHSSELWLDGELVGGAYGVSIGRMFYGESMFARVTDGSKIALAHLVRFLQARGVAMIDCQQETKHLASLGAAPISRARFLAHLRVAIEAAQITDWQAATAA